MNDKTLPRGSLVDYASHRPQDLIPAFLDLLKDVDAPEYDRRLPSYAMEDQEHQWWNSEECNWLLEELFDTLDQYAPDDHYFGAHPGNGTDFGVWHSEGDL